MKTKQILLKENLKYEGKDDLGFGNKNGDTGLLTTNKLIAFTACNVLPEFTCGTHVITTGMEMSSTLSAVTLEGISKSYFITFHC